MTKYNKRDISSSDSDSDSSDTEPNNAIEKIYSYYNKKIIRKQLQIERKYIRRRNRKLLRIKEKEEETTIDKEEKEEEEEEEKEEKEEEKEEEEEQYFDDEPMKMKKPQIRFPKDILLQILELVKSVADNLSYRSIRGSKTVINWKKSITDGVFSEFSAYKISPGKLCSLHQKHFVFKSLII